MCWSSCRAVISSIKRSGLVVAGYCSSWVSSCGASFSALWRFFLPTSLSLHTAKLCKGVSLSCVHSVKVCDNNDKLGTRNNTRLPLPAKFSAIFKLVKVLPVPHAIINLPRLAVSKPFWVDSNAAFWWSRNDFLGLRTIGWLGWYCSHAIWLCSSAYRSILLTGGCWSANASSACLLQCWQVLTMIRWLKCFLPDAVKKLSISLFCSL